MNLVIILVELRYQNPIKMCVHNKSEFWPDAIFAIFGTKYSYKNDSSLTNTHYDLLQASRLIVDDNLQEAADNEVLHRDGFS